MNYPKEIETYHTIRGSSEIFIRPIKPTDEPLMGALFRSFSKETVYLRFFGFIKEMTHERLQYFVNVDYDQRMAVVGVVKHEGVEKIIAVGRYDLDRSTNMAEIALVVQAEWQNKGIGSFLLDYLMQIAESRGITGFTADILAENTRMLHLIRKMGHKLDMKRIGEVYRISLKF